MSQLKLNLPSKENQIVKLPNLVKGALNLLESGMKGY